LVELRDVGPEVAPLLLVLDAWENHLGAWDFGSRVRNVFEEHVLAPGDAGVLVGIRVAVIRGGTGFAAVDPVQLRTDLVLGAVADRVTGKALLERGFTGGDVL